MTTVKGRAPAKVNLTLHITGQRRDGYHSLDSLVVFAGIFDEITATTAADLRLRVNGPFAQGVPTDDDNLVLRAARVLQAARGVKMGANLTLEKNLPHAAGIGSGSSDAAKTLEILAQLWQVEPLPDTAPEVVALGADVPVCLKAPTPMRMTGVGDELAACPALPDCAFVLVNPRVTVPTGAVFDALTTKDNPAMDDVPTAMNFADFTSWLGSQRNDLYAPASQIAPDVEAAIAILNRMPKVAFAGMSGSGATCFGVVRDMADARDVARAVQVSEMNWWVAPAQLL